MKTMNKLKKTSLLVMAFLMVSISCSDEFLELAPTGSLADAQVSTKAGIEGLLIGTYAAVNGVFGNRFEGPNHWVTGSIVGGEANKGTDAGDYSSINPVQRYEIDPTNGDINNLWRGRFEGISRANAVLSALEKADDIIPSEVARIAGEARLLRGHFYFDLKKHFNSVPII
ncbi:MAG: RagB/SusD family nutrient uptake outer membrane protein, partial [Pricia sp.]|nr:RagB/SusD family nutrient uptake outer membrane protein [Pricia sp.]